MTSGNFTITQAEEYVGSKIGLSAWLVIGQQQIDAFASMTNDHQWIHVDGPEAYAGPFGGPIAHGLLLLSLTLSMAQESGAFPSDAGSVAIYGYDKVRFHAPVPAGSRVRCRTTLLEVRRLGNRVVLKVRFEVELEGCSLPALAADCLLLIMP